MSAIVLLLGMIAALLVSTGTAPAIVNGQDASLRWAASWQNVTSSGPTQECGGAVIAPSWVLTAKHCEQFIRTGPLGHGQVRVGSLNWRQGEVRQVAQVFFPPDRPLEGTFGNDALLLRLAQPVDVRTTPILALDIGPEAGLKALALGWGTTCDLFTTGKLCIPDRLQQLAVKQVPDSECLLHPDGVERYDSGTMWCYVTQDDNLKAGTCFRDSGGPLVRQVAGVTLPVVAGIANADMGWIELEKDFCTTDHGGRRNHGGATTVSVFVPWIVGTLAQHDPVAAEYVQSHLTHIG